MTLGSSSDHIYKVLLNSEKKELGRVLLENSWNDSAPSWEQKKKKKKIEFGGLLGMWYICAQQ